jgi:AcrR family transcriptional regulator
LFVGVHAGQVPSPTAAVARRTQAERTAATTTKILDAAAECLIELGWSGTSTPEVCRRAGVSRGALLHHYPTKQELIAASVLHVMARRTEEFRATLATLPLDASYVTRLETAIDVLWGIYQGDSAGAWLEFHVAARTDDALRPVLAQTAALMQQEIERVWAELFPPDPETFLPDAFYTVAPVFLFTLLDGLAVRRLSGAPDAGAQAEVVILALKVIIRRLAETSPEELTAHLDAILGGAP